MVKALCERGADMTMEEAGSSRSALWLALEGGQEDVASVLVSPKVQISQSHWLKMRNGVAYRIAGSVVT